ncbi:uncharacterized protein PHALS_06718 [Plasmopara halstedii]|uniref:Uncharacterized protein n=1 Tax=Plasmopara halstedii TaxID=4781 RepID=A0A0P1B2J2_PLAHL|nr:uncharacterized protein PHALS_06718 [Plasmopara halstedii]CEG48926.1 hypothetical protein PHALS_06718 [Plasmopara halstedii]|eukprot:XP_024585295.1 hypothetical protein PHALS_06718 [Plasmopara halstedii]
MGVVLRLAHLHLFQERQQPRMHQDICCTDVADPATNLLNSTVTVISSSDSPNTAYIIRRRAEIAASRKSGPAFAHRTLTIKEGFLPASSRTLFRYTRRVTGSLYEPTAIQSLLLISS